MWSMTWSLLSHLCAGHRRIVLDVPLLFESKTLVHFCGVTVLVACPTEVQVKRLMDRNGYSRQQALERIAAQMPLKEKRERADVTVENDASLEDLARAVDRMLARLPDLHGDALSRVF